MVHSKQSKVFHIKMAGKIANLNLVSFTGYFCKEYSHSNQISCSISKNSLYFSPNSNWLILPPFLCSKLQTAWNGSFQAWLQKLYIFWKSYDEYFHKTLSWFTKKWFYKIVYTLRFLWHYISICKSIYANQGFSNFFSNAKNHCHFFLAPKRSLPIFFCFLFF